MRYCEGGKKISARLSIEDQKLCENPHRTVCDVTAEDVRRWWDRAAELR